MGKVRRRSLKTFRSLSEGPTLPPWVKLVPFVVAAFLFFTVSAKLFSKPAELVNDMPPGSGVESIISNLDDPGLQEIFAAASGSSVPLGTQSSIPAPAGSDQPVDSSLPPLNPTETSVQDQAELDGTTKLEFSGNGSAIPVPNQALEVARAACVGLFTGSFTSVPLAPGVAIPSLPRTWPNPSVSDPRVESVGDGVFEFSFRVDPDRNGPATLREIRVSIEYIPGSQWVWSGV
jgi:hypothetical protein